MARFVLKRLGLAVVTLFLLSLLVFFLAQQLPGDVGRAILGPLADQASVDRLNHQLGTDQPILTQYVNQMKGYLHGDMGKSVSTRQPISEVLWHGGWPAVVADAWPRRGWAERLHQEIGRASCRERVLCVV